MSEKKLEINTHDFIVDIFTNYDDEWQMRMRNKMRCADQDAVFLVRNKDYKQRVLDWAFMVGRADITAKIKKGL